MTDEEKLSVSNHLCGIRRAACLTGRRWVVGVLVTILSLVGMIGASMLATERARADDHERRITRTETNVDEIIKRLDRFEGKLDRVLERKNP